MGDRSQWPAASAHDAGCTCLAGPGKIGAAGAPGGRRSPTGQMDVHGHVAPKTNGEPVSPVLTPRPPTAHAALSIAIRASSPRSVSSPRLSCSSKSEPSLLPTPVGTLGSLSHWAQLLLARLVLCDTVSAEGSTLQRVAPAPLRGTPVLADALHQLRAVTGAGSEPELPALSQPGVGSDCSPSASLREQSQETVSASLCKVTFEVL